MPDNPTTKKPKCPHCNGKGYVLGWIDPGGVMQAVPEDCDYCAESRSAAPGVEETNDA